MSKCACSILAALTLATFAHGQTVPAPGLVITHSTKLRAGRFLVPAPGDETGPAAIVIRGNGITVDFAGAELRGTPATAMPDQRKGVGIRVEGRNVTIKNVWVHGYKVALIARNVPGLRIVDSDFSYNWKQRLLSTVEKEDESDWQSYHQNEKDEWLRYGAGIYLRDCNGFEVRNTRIVGGQCGLMITQCNKGLVWNDDFSFNSGLGMGLYRSSDNRVMHNKMDWDVRGFSYGVYNRGQDSAGILIFEQCMRNVFAYNSVTHGGDGFFLWAGQTTMDTGQGGCNDNLLYGNDWSHAPTNGIEATFSRNKFVNNKVLECWHGIWGGYSYNTQVVGNAFGYNGEGIAWEHGQDDSVTHNTFYRNNRDIHIWSNTSQDPNWGYGKKRDTRSRDWTIAHNLFSNTTQDALLAVRSTKIGVENNRFDAVKALATVGPNATAVTLASDNETGSSESRLPGVVDATGDQILKFANSGAQPLPGTIQPSGLPVIGLDPSASDYIRRFDVAWNPWPTKPSGSGAARQAVLKFAPQPLKGGIDPFLKSGTLRGQRYIIVDEWGPYDFKRPILVDRGAVAGGSSRRFEVLGPKGVWKLMTADGGVRLSASSGPVPGFVDVTMEPGKAANVNITLQYVGGKIVDVRGIESPAGKAVQFGYKRFFAPIDWKIAIYPWTKSSNAADPHAAPDADGYRQAIAGEPARVVESDRLDYAGYSFLPGTPSDHFATVADGSFNITPGTYTIEVTSDDGVRVWLDGKLIVDQWHYESPTSYSVPVTLGGSHKLHVEHFQIDGYAALKVSIKQRR